MSEELEAKIKEYRIEIGEGAQLKHDFAVLMWGTIKEHGNIKKDYLFEISKEHYQKLPEKPFGKELQRHTFNEILSIFESVFDMKSNFSEVYFD